MIYRYVKAPPGYTLEKPLTLGLYFRKAVSAFLLTVGIAAFTSVTYPILYYQIKLAPRLVTVRPVAPVPNSEVPDNPIKTAQAAEPRFVPEMINTTLDYTDADNWFPQAQAAAPAAQTPDMSYNLSIPKLAIDGANVVTTQSDLKKSLIHYPGTALPGDLGNTVVFGHSVLPQFFSPTNYVSIFSTLHTLEAGDEVVLNADGVIYRYRITDMYEVMPDNLTPLAQNYSGRYLTLITCTPPGTYLRRLIVKAELL